jgi:DegV family protein with EDD domain
MTPTVAVVTDSAASLPAGLAQKWGVRVVPMQVIVDGTPHSEGTDIGPQEVLANLLAGLTVTTSQPSPAAFENAFREAELDGATAIVAVLISGKLSGTVSVAQAAAGRVSVPVHVVDSESVAMATGFAAVAAAALAATGADAEAVADEARRVAASSLCMFTVDDLNYLRKGGRISPAVAAVGRVLGVRPLLEVVDGEVSLYERVRTTARARAALLECADESIGDRLRPALAVMALGDADYVDEAARALGAAHEHLALTVCTPVSAVLAAHAGPGALAIVVVDLPPHVV